MPLTILAPSTLQAQTLRRETTMRLQTEIDRSGLEVATGRLADPYEALGRSASRLLTLGADLDRVENFLTSNGLLSGRLDAQEEALGRMRDIADEVMALSLPNRSGITPSSDDVQAMAMSAIRRITDLGNTVYGGRTLFSGVDTDNRAFSGWTEAGAGGTSIADEMAAILGAGPTNAADAATMAAQVDALFGGTGYSDTLYRGAPATGPRLGARIGPEEDLQFGEQGDDPGFRDLMQGLAMIAALDTEGLSDAAYGEWMKAATEKLSSGLEGVLGAETRTGIARGRVEEAVTALENRRDLYMSEQHKLEGVDPYAAASRFTELESRLQASYAITARLSNLSFLNYM
ncbi:flagellin [Litorisediminicola beolgyonensis]|uniref:Flagellin n=1 Tax=Litorisediminicola beolgyonensis TaxID=1173614 RepID=A0ABW3ZG09_9RHOB